MSKNDSNLSSLANNPKSSLDKGKCQMSSLYWGTIAEDPIEIEPLNSPAKPESMATFQIPPLHQPCSAASKEVKTNSQQQIPSSAAAKKVSPWLKAPSDSQGQNYMFQSIELQHYKRRMKYMLAAAQSHQLEMMKGSTSDASTLPSPPPPPKRFCSSEGRLAWKQPKTFLANSTSTSTSSSTSDESSMKPATAIISLLDSGQQCPVTLSSLSARQLMCKAVSAVCAHVGFECSSDMALDTLTDVIASQLFSLCKVLKVHAETSPPQKDTLQTMDHVLKQFGYEGVQSLKTYWDLRISNVALTLEQEDQELLQEYNNLKDSCVSKPTTAAAAVVVNIKEEKPESL